MATSNARLIVAGSFGYMAFYFLDYVDGGVARIRRQSGLGGQYVDWTMHAVSAVGVALILLSRVKAAQMASFLVANWLPPCPHGR